MDKNLSLIINIYTIVNKYTFIILIFITIMCVNTFYTLDVSKRFVQSIDANAIKIPLWSFKTFCTEQLHILRVIFDTVSQTRKKRWKEIFILIISLVTFPFSSFLNNKQSSLELHIDSCIDWCASEKIWRSKTKFSSHLSNWLKWGYVRFGGTDWRDRK